MAMTYTESGFRLANFGGFADAVGGLAAVVLAVVALAGLDAGIMIAIATVILGAALLVQSGEMLSEYASITVPRGASATSSREFGGGNIAAVLIVGAAGIVLGILALVGIHPVALPATAVIAFGSALVLSSSAAWHLYTLRQASAAATPSASEWQSGSEILAGEMASGSAGAQALAGLGSVVLGVLAVIGLNPEVLTLTAVLVLGAAVILGASATSGAILNVVRPSPTSSRNT
jgi:hypothetical protein